jgi:hypothetical protein
MTPEDMLLISLDFSHSINVTMIVRFFWGSTVGYFIVQNVEGHGFDLAPKEDAKLKVQIPVNIY